MRDYDMSVAPDFRRTCVVMFGVNITWIFTVVWAIWGLIIVILLGAVINHMMTRLKDYSDARAAHDRAFPKAKARD